MRHALAALALMAIGLVAVPAWAQIRLEAPPPPAAPEPAVVAPNALAPPTRPNDADNYPGGTLVPYDPAFIGPLSTKTETATSTGRVGVAGWTAPNTPIGPAATGWREVNGWFALGFALEWGGPPPAKRPAR